MKAFVLSGLLLACSVADSAAQSPVGPKWLIARIGNDAFAGEAQSKTRFVLNSGRLSASVGCNGIGGTYTLKNTAIAFEGLIMTRMFCAGLDKSERALTQALRNARSWRIERDSLVLQDERGSTLISFVRASR